MLREKAPEVDPHIAARPDMQGVLLQNRSKPINVVLGVTRSRLKIEHTSKVHCCDFFRRSPPWTESLKFKLISKTSMYLTSLGTSRNIYMALCREPAECERKGTHSRYAPTLSSNKRRFFKTTSLFVEVCVCGRQKKAIVRALPELTVWAMLMLSSMESWPGPHTYFETKLSSL